MDGTLRFAEGGRSKGLDSSVAGVLTDSLNRSREAATLRPMPGFGGGGLSDDSAVWSEDEGDGERDKWDTVGSELGSVVERLEAVRVNDLRGLCGREGSMGW